MVLLICMHSVVVLTERNWWLTMLSYYYDERRNNKEIIEKILGSQELKTCFYLEDMGHVEDLGWRSTTEAEYYCYYNHSMTLKKEQTVLDLESNQKSYTYNFRILLRHYQSLDLEGQLTVHRHQTGIAL